MLDRILGAVLILAGFALAIWAGRRWVRNPGTRAAPRGDTLAPLPEPSGRFAPGVHVPFTPRARCSDPPEESCSDAGCPVHGWDQEPCEESPEQARVCPECARDTGEEQHQTGCPALEEARVEPDYTIVLSSGRRLVPGGDERWTEPGGPASLPPWEIGRHERAAPMLAKSEGWGPRGPSASYDEWLAEGGPAALPAPGLLTDEQAAEIRARFLAAVAENRPTVWLPPDRPDADDAFDDVADIIGDRSPVVADITSAGSRRYPADISGDVTVITGTPAAGPAPGREDHDHLMARYERLIDSRPRQVQELLHYHRDSDEAVDSIMFRTLTPDVLAILDAAKGASDA